MTLDNWSTICSATLLDNNISPPNGKNGYLLAFDGSILSQPTLNKTQNLVIMNQKTVNQFEGK